MRFLSVLFIGATLLGSTADAGIIFRRGDGNPTLFQRFQSRWSQRAMPSYDPGYGYSNAAPGYASPAGCASCASAPDVQNASYAAPAHAMPGSDLQPASFSQPTADAGSRPLASLPGIGPAPSPADGIGRPPLAATNPTPNPSSVYWGVAGAKPPEVGVPALLPDDAKDHYLERQSIAEQNCWASAIQCAIYNVGAGYYTQDHIMWTAQRWGGLPYGQTPGIVRQLVDARKADMFTAGVIPKANLVDYLKRGGKAVITCHAPFGHSMAITGVDQTGQYLALMDPRFGEKVWVTYDYLVHQRQWFETTLLMPKSPTSVASR